MTGVGKVKVIRRSCLAMEIQGLVKHLLGTVIKIIYGERRGRVGANMPRY